MTENKSLSTLNPVASVMRQAMGLRPLAVTPKRKYLALLLAGVVDVAQATVLAPYTSIPGAASPIEWGVDIATSVLLVAILGWNWRLLVAFVVELIPMASMFPTWSALILTITALTPTEETSAKPLPTPAVPPGTSLPQGTPDFSALPPPDFKPEVPAAKAPGAPQKFPGTYHQRSR